MQSTLSITKAIAIILLGFLFVYLVDFERLKWVNIIIKLVNILCLKLVEGDSCGVDACAENIIDFVQSQVMTLIKQILKENTCILSLNSPISILAYIDRIAHFVIESNLFQMHCIRARA